MPDNIQLGHTTPCPRCGGSGFTGQGSGYGSVCEECGGTRYISQERAQAFASTQTREGFTPPSNDAGAGLRPVARPNENAGFRAMVSRIPVRGIAAPPNQTVAEWPEPRTIESRPAQQRINHHVCRLRGPGFFGEAGWRAFRSLRSGQLMWLKRQSSNPADPNAIIVQTLEGEPCGYVARDVAAQIAADLDRDMLSWRCKIDNLPFLRIDRERQ